MDNTNYNNTETVINLKTVIWDLLSQWKAVLIAAVLVAVAITGLKYAKEMRTYQAAMGDAKSAEEQADVPAEDRIEAILSELSDEDRDAVDFISNEKDLLRMQKDYLDNSILMNSEPTDQRAITINYKVTATDPADLGSIINAHIWHLRDDAFIGAIGEVIDPDAEYKYINELVEGHDADYLHIDSENGSVILPVSIVIPHDVDADKLEQTATAELKRFASEMSGKLGENKIEAIDTTDYIRSSIYTAQDGQNVAYGIYNLQNNIKNGENALSDEAKDALAAIEEIKAAEDAEETAADAGGAQPGTETSEIAAPGISKKYALLGFVLGICLYAFAYVIMIILRGRVASPEDVSTYTGSRLFGEVYYPEVHNGVRALLHSKAVDNIRYKGKLDQDKQADKIAESLETACAHNGIDKLTAICVSDFSDAASEAAKAVTDKIRGKGLEVSLIDDGSDLSEKDIAAVDNIIYIAGRDTRISTINELSALSREYGIRQMGNIYVQSV